MISNERYDSDNISFLHQKINRIYSIHNCVFIILIFSIEYKARGLIALFLLLI